MSKPVAAAPWSFSKMKNFDTCPKQFYHVTVLKEHPFVETEAVRYGSAFHKAAEDYIGEGKPLPPAFDFAKPVLDSLNSKRGDKLVERKMGLTADLEPCSFYAKDVWFRGIADLLILDHNAETAWVIDYKTGKSARYADKGQLELMALTVFKHFPDIKKVRAGLLFVVCNDIVRDTYLEEITPDLWGKWMGKYGTMEKAFETGVWNPKPSGLCRRHCPVTECPHNGAN